MRSSIQVVLLLLSTWWPGIAVGAPGDAVQIRMSADLEAGRVLVAHVIVALADNENQGIVPIPKSLGNGMNPSSNLYWGAAYGVRTYLGRTAKWREVEHSQPSDSRILERAVFQRRVRRGGKDAVAYVVADAWRGVQIKAAIGRFLAMAAGGASERISVGDVEFAAGGDSHLIAYVGHNGLMDFSVEAPALFSSAPARSVVALACASQQYFETTLVGLGAHPLLLTRGLMAPEAYSLSAAIETWFAGAPASEVREAAAREYNKYQRCGENAARRLFHSSP